MQLPRDVQTTFSVKIISDAKDSLTTAWNLPTWNNLKMSIYIHENIYTL